MRKKEIYKTTLLGTIANFLLLAIKFTAGIFGNSSAMIADAVHSLSDFITDLIVFFFVHLSDKPQDKNHDYGHGKYETLATALIGVILLFIGLFLCWNSICVIYNFIFCNTSKDVPTLIPFIVAVISIFIKEMMYVYTKKKGLKFNSTVLIANAWHHRSDAISSIASAIGLGCILVFGEKWVVLDSVAAFLVSFFISKVALELLIPAIEELLEKSLSEETENKIKNIVLSFPGVYHPHNLRTRRIGNYYAIELHIRMEGNISLNQAHYKTVLIERKLKKEFGYETHIGIHVEPLKDK